MRATTTYQPANPALVIQAFWPLSTQKSPSRCAVVFRLPASLPAPGSVRPKPPSVSPEASDGSTRRFSSSLPKRTIGQPQTELVTLIVTATAASAREISSTASR